MTTTTAQILPDTYFMIMPPHIRRVFTRMAQRLGMNTPKKILWEPIMLNIGEWTLALGCVFSTVYAIETYRIKYQLRQDALSRISHFNNSRKPHAYWEQKRLEKEKALEENTYME